MENKPLAVAFVHDWLDTYRGGEKVLEELLALYPDAPIFTMFYRKHSLPKSITTRRIIYPKWLQPLQRFRKLLLPWLPAIIESFDLSGYDLVISSSSCVAKGVITSPTAKHLCYLHSPMRYVWDQRDHYLPKGGPIRFLYEIIASKLRVWDAASSHRVDRYVCNSTFVRARVKKFYGKPAQVVHPPIWVNKQSSGAAQKGDYFLVAGAMVAYKQFELAIAACKLADVPLVVAGGGPLAGRLRRLCTGKVRFVHQPNDDKLLELLSNSRALLFPGVEDFGMLPIEAMSLGTPVIALAKGGALDYIREGETGLGVQGQEPETWAEAIRAFDGDRFDSKKIIDFSQNFSKGHFQAKMREQIKEVLREK